MRHHNLSLRWIIVLCLFAIGSWGRQINVQDPESTAPRVKPTVTRGMIIDAGSGGSRLHIYQWKPRIFNSVPPPLSYPESNEKWTGRVESGIHRLGNDSMTLQTHLARLIDFAKVQLAGLEEEFDQYPLYFKATGGMRELESTQRDKLMSEVRKLLLDKSFCPFYFRNDFARIISGEEEAVFSWAAVNFLMKTLLPNSNGQGLVRDVNATYGTLDLGGASTQIAFYVPTQDIAEGLYKLQLGGQKQWNVYAKSFLRFGVVSVRHRMTQMLAETAVRLAGGISAVLTAKTQRLTITTPCFHTGYSEEYILEEGHTRIKVEITGPTSTSSNQLHLCRYMLKPLMEKDMGAFCEEVYHGECSIAGAYQPRLPGGKHGQFIGTSSYKYPWGFLNLPRNASLDLLSHRAKDLCEYNFGEVLNYYELTDFTFPKEKLESSLPYYCFLSSYVLTLLEDGYRFNRNQTLTVLDEVDGHKVGWALGAILYEINELPWELQLTNLEQYPFHFVFTAATIGFIAGAIAAIAVYREFVDPRSAGVNGRYDVIDGYEPVRQLETIDAIRLRRTSEPDTSRDKMRSYQQPN